MFFFDSVCFPALVSSRFLTGKIRLRVRPRLGSVQGSFKAHRIENSSADFLHKCSNPNFYVCVCFWLFVCVFMCVCVCLCVGLVHKNRFNCPSCFKSYRTMLDLAQHRCSAAAKNQVGVSVSEAVCEEEESAGGEA